MDNKQERRLIDISDLDAPEGWEESDIPNLGEMLMDMMRQPFEELGKRVVQTLGRPFSELATSLQNVIEDGMLRKEAQEIDEFLVAIGIDDDDPLLDNASWNELLEDARNVKKTLAKYGRTSYLPQTRGKPGNKRRQIYDDGFRLVQLRGMSYREAFEELTSSLSEEMSENEKLSAICKEFGLEHTAYIRLEDAKSDAFEKFKSAVSARKRGRVRAN